jgi:hypothetical protein
MCVNTFIDLSTTLRSIEIYLQILYNLVQMLCFNVSEHFYVLNRLFITKVSNEPTFHCKGFH